MPISSSLNSVGPCSNDLTGLSERPFGALALSLALSVGIMLVIMHVLEPEHNSDPVSLYSLGTFGFVMRVGFLLLGLAFFLLLLGLWYEARNTGPYYADLILFFISGLGLVLIGLFNTDAPGTTSPTNGGMIHSYAAITWSLACSIGILAFAVGRLDCESLMVERWLRNLGVITPIVWFAGFFAQLSIMSTAQPRIFYSLVIAWMVLVANQLRAGGLRVASDPTT